jgi:triacylglycerol lipase
MTLDTTWEALVHPERATDFFAGPEPARFDVEAPGYSPVNAWWLAEISRLIYRRELAEEPGFTGETRRAVLNRAGLDEVAFIHESLAQCAIVKPLDPAGPSFVVLVFRGSHDLLDWLTNVHTLPVGWATAPGKVHEGFRDALECVVEQIDRALGGFACPAFYTGHSLGAALATLAAFRSPEGSVRAVYAFGSPRVGDAAFLAALDEKAKVYRVVHSRDVVTTVPPVFLGFAHTGELHYITRDGELLVDPSEDRMDRRQPFLFDSALHHPARLLEPPEDLADHSPINYVTRLREALRR